MVDEPQNPLEAVLSLLKGLSTPTRRIERTQHPDGVIVSTIEMSDLNGYETAVISNIGDGETYPVERYDTEAKARAGHLKWVDLTADAHHVTQLGYGNVIEPEIKRIR